MIQEMLKDNKISRRELLRLGGIGFLSSVTLSLSSCSGQAPPEQRVEPPMVIPISDPVKPASTTSPYEVSSLPMATEQREIYINHARTIENILQGSLLPNIMQGISSPELKTLINNPLLRPRTAQLDYDLYRAMNSVRRLSDESRSSHVYRFNQATFTIDDPASD